MTPLTLQSFCAEHKDSSLLGWWVKNQSVGILCPCGQQAAWLYVGNETSKGEA